MIRLRFQKLQDRLPLLVLVFCIAQPLLDIAGYWQSYFGVSNAATLALRMLLLGGCVLLGFLLSDRKRYYLIAAAVLGLLTLGHALACMQAKRGYLAAVTDLVNLVRIYFLPLTTLCFITFLKKNEKVFAAMQKGMVVDIFLIAAVQFISEITGTDPHTYAVDKVGVLGWFLWTNSQSAILAMLAPITICWALNRWRDRVLPIILITLICEATLFELAPRLAYGSLAAAGLGVTVCLLIADRKRWRQALAVGLVTLMFLGLYPFSATNSRLGSNEVRLQEAEELVESLDIVLETEVVATNEQGQAEEVEFVLDATTFAKLEKLYRSQDIIWNMVHRFGARPVFRAYNYTLNPKKLANTRNAKIKFCELLMKESGTVSRLFGLNLEEMRVQREDFYGNLVTDNYDVENDFHGVYFLTGWVGLGLMVLFLLYFGVRALLRVLRQPKVYFHLTMAAFAMAYGLALIHAYFTASVLRRNNASVYLAMVLAGLWYLSEKRHAERKDVSAQ